MNSLALVERSATVSQITAALHAVPTIGRVEDAMSARETVDAMRAALSKLSDASAARVAATKLEIALTRRIGQLGGAKLLKGSQRASMARALADMSDEEFDKLTSTIVEECTPISWWRDNNPTTKRMYEAWERQREEHVRRLMEDGQYAAEFNEKRQQAEVVYEASRKRHAVASALDELLSELDAGDEPFTKAELVSQIRESVTGHESEYEWADDPELGALLGEMAEKALASTALTEDGMPSRVTYFDAELGWIRIPWGAASLLQLSAHALYAQQQADELQAKADRLQALVDDYATRTRGDEDWTTKLSVLSRRKSLT